MATKGVINWSKTAATNATADSAVNWAEGMAPSAVNDSARNEMASVAMWRDDISGALTTGGTSTAYTVTTNQDIGSLAAMNGQIITIVPNVTNGTDPTLSVNGLTAKPIRQATGTYVASGVMVAGTPYQLVYYSSAGEFILLGFTSNPYIIPIGGVLPYVGTSAPNSNFALMYGQAISRTTYATLFSLVSTTFGAGDGSTMFNIPDIRGRVIAGKDDMGGSSADRLTNQTGGLNGDTLGATGGSETHTLTQAQLAAHTHTASVTDPGHTHVYSAAAGQAGSGIAGGTQYIINQTPNTNSATTGITVSNSSTGSDSAHNNVQPTIILTYILRLI